MAILLTNYELKMLNNPATHRDIITLFCQVRKPA
jgi:hypothetical protein